MAKEWIDVVDTAVKIGLGALISGTFTYLGLKFKASSENKKFMTENKAKMLEEVSADVHNYFTAWRFYASIIYSITKNKNSKDEDGSDFTEGQKKSIKERSDDLIESWPKRESAIAKLTLLKASRVVEAIIDCRELENELRSQIIFDNQVPLYAYMQDYKKNIRERVDKVNTELSDFYSTLET